MSTWTPRATVEQLAALTSTLWLVGANGPFVAAALHGRDRFASATWAFGLALAVMLWALHFIVVALLANRFTVKPVLAVLLLVGAFASHFSAHYEVVLDPAMLRNVLHTDWHEARELFSLSMLPRLALLAGLPLLLLWKVQIVKRPLVRAIGVRLASLAGAAALLLLALLAAYQPLASLMRNQRELRYRVTPANVLWSLASAGGAEARGATRARAPIGLDARLEPEPAPAAALQRARVLVIVVGETARAANWGLSGYARQTTPQLAALPVINAAEVTSCGTHTEASLPCMFAPVGRRAYDEGRIRGSESLLHVLARAGVGVHWRDNQSGCKGVCEGLGADSVAQLDPPGLCEGGRCLDEGLLHGLGARLGAARGTQVLVLHQLGNHGPAYFRRYPRSFAKFQPACEKDDLQRCSREEIVNAYDNALLYTDHVLARLIGELGQSGTDAALLYVSDHGESLGEANLWLHGLPYSIAPEVQKRVPMVLWLSDGFARRAALDTGCLRQRLQQPAAHDHLFHTVLGLLGVRTALYESEWDLSAGCRQPGALTAAR